jgi:hypothetical protein
MCSAFVVCLVLTEAILFCDRSIHLQFVNDNLTAVEFISLDEIIEL